MNFSAKGKSAMSDAIPTLASGLTLRALTTRAYRVPMNFALGTSATMITSAPLLLVDAQMEEGVVGHAYVFCYATSGESDCGPHRRGG
jgi:mandelate racemase